MGRKYGEKLKASLENKSDDRLGYRLARLCIRANLSAKRVAEMLGVSKTTVHKWFRGTGVKESNFKAVEGLIDKLTKEHEQQTTQV